METLLGELDECIPDHRGPEQAAEERVLAECVSAFLRGQTADNRYIFLRRLLVRRGYRRHRKASGLRREPGKICPVPHEKGPAGIFGKGGDRGMKAERLFRAIGLVDEGLIEAAAETPAKKRPVWRRYAAAAACLMVLCGAGAAYLITGGFRGYGAAGSTTRAALQTPSPLCRMPGRCCP